MVRQPLIRFRYAIRKAMEAGVAPNSGPHAGATLESTSISRDAKAITPKNHSSRPSTRIDQSVPRAPLTNEEMDAIMVRFVRGFQSLPVVVAANVDPVALLTNQLNDVFTTSEKNKWFALINQLGGAS